MRAPCGNSPSKTSGQVLLGGKGRADGDATLICPVARLAARSRYRDARRPVELCPRGCRLAGGRPGGRFLAPDRLRQPAPMCAVHRGPGGRGHPLPRHRRDFRTELEVRWRVPLRDIWEAERRPLLCPRAAQLVVLHFPGKEDEREHGGARHDMYRGQREFAEEIWRPRPPEPLG